MTATQTAIPAKKSQSMTGPLAAVAVGLMVAVIGVAINARPVAAPVTVTHGSTPLTLGHDEARPSYVQSLPRKNVPSNYRVQPKRPAAQPTELKNPHFRGQ
ncbi:MAG: hypothetical protein M3P84_05525 [Chloroflexota bacterium]|nr:hypothetical protein [Chloroflexota bacterium]